MHQKQPPAKIAVLVVGAGASWSRLGSARSAAAANSRARSRILFMIVDLRHRCGLFVPRPRRNGQDRNVIFELAQMRHDCHKRSFSNQKGDSTWLNQSLLFLVSFLSSSAFWALSLPSPPTECC